MEESTLLGVAFMLICVMFIMLLIAFTKLHNIRKCIGDVKPKDMYPFLEELRELVIESERVADKLEDAISKKEAMLEDISSLAEDKLKRLETIRDVPTAPRGQAAPNFYAQPQMTAQETLQLNQPIHEFIAEQKQGLTISDRISDMIQIGMSDAQIASELGISTTEVQIVRKLDIA